MFSFASRLRALLVLTALSVAAAGFVAPGAPAPPSEAAFHPMQQMFFLKKMKPDVKRVGIIWKRGSAGQAAKMESIRRAVGSIQGELFVAYVERTSDIGAQFRLLTRKHDVQALWVVENDGLVDADAPRQYLIENAAKQGIPLLAPTEDWVSAGAPLAVVKAGDEFRLLINEPAAAATALSVPAEYKAQTKLVAAN